MPHEGRRFSPLTAPEREGVDIFLAEARPWALRQAKRTYRHLPADLQEQAVEDAMVLIRSGAAHSDRRSLYAELSEALDESLRRVHVGWCLSQAPSLYQGRETANPDRGFPTPPGEPITRFIEAGLSGLERAVLQLEIGAGRESSVVRAALRLGPRQYLRHREAGLAKLRLAIEGQLADRVCKDHLTAVTLAATGDRGAGDDLSAGRERCRSCAREASLMRRVLHERLAMAPWPLAVKPAGILIAKLGGLSAVLSGSKTIGGGSLVAGAGTSGATPVLAGIIAASVMATGTLAAAGVGEGEKTERAAARVAPAAQASATAAKPVAAVANTTAERATTKTSKRTRAGFSDTRAAGGATTAATRTPAGEPASAPAAAGTNPTGAVKPTVDKVTDTVRDTVRKVTRKVPAKVKVPRTGIEVQIPDLQTPVDNVVDAANALLAP